MTKPDYIFADTQLELELTRLQALETVCDPLSHRLLRATGMTTGWHCLEVGAGAGSIMRWMSDIVGRAGKVTAIDLDTRFIKDVRLDNVEVIEADVDRVDLAPESFDLIHVRNVLIHQKDRHFLSKILQLLKPQGWLVIEEPDFSALKFTAGTQAQQQAVTKVNRAICQMFTNRGKDYALGAKLPSLLQQLNLQRIAVENDAPISPGGSDIAVLMKLSVRQLTEKYVATNKVTPAEIETYCEFADNPTSWGIFLATVGVVAQKPSIAKT